METGLEDLERELETRGQAILGGDVQVAVWQRGLSEAERAALDRLGFATSGELSAFFALVTPAEALTLHAQLL